MTGNSAPAAPPRALVKSVLWMLGAIASFSALAVAVRGLKPVLSPSEMLTLRSLSGVVILGVLALLMPSLRGQFAPQDFKLHLARSFVHFIGQFGWVTGVTLLPLAIVFALEFTVPAWVALFAVLFLAEKMNAGRLSALALGFAGVLIILRPGVVPYDPAVLIVLMASVAFAVTMILTKKLTLRNATFTILFWMNLIQLPMNYVFSDPLFLLKLPQAPLYAIALMCVTGLAAHYCLTNAFRHADALVIVPLDFLRIPLIAGVGFWLYNEPLDGWVFVGAAVILAGIFANLRQEAAGARQSNAS